MLSLIAFVRWWSKRSRLNNLRQHHPLRYLLSLFSGTALLAAAWAVRCCLASGSVQRLFFAGHSVSLPDSPYDAKAPLSQAAPAPVGLLRSARSCPCLARPPPHYHRLSGGTRIIELDPSPWDASSASPSPASSTRIQLQAEHIWGLLRSFSLLTLQQQPSSQDARRLHQTQTTMPEAHLNQAGDQDAERKSEGERGGGTGDKGRGKRAKQRSGCIHRLQQEVLRASLSLEEIQTALTRCVWLLRHEWNFVEHDSMCPIFLP